MTYSTYCSDESVTVTITNKETVSMFMDSLSSDLLNLVTVL